MNLILDEWIDLGVRGCRSITATQRRTVETNCTDVSIEETPVELQENLVAHWNFNEAIAAGTHLASFGTSVLSHFGAPTIVAGHLRNAVRIPNGAGLLGGSIEGADGFGDYLFTIHLWIKFETFPAATADIISKADNDTGYILRISNTGTLTWFIGNGSAYTSAVWGSALSLNTWYQVICGWDGTNVVLQVNTESVLGVAATSPLAAWLGSGQNLNIPRVPAATCTFLLDTLISWTSFLGLTDRTTLWNNGAGVPGPAFGSGQIIRAIQGQSYRLVVYGVGGTEPYTWTVVSGSLPTGLTLNGLTGIFSGTPTDLGDFDFAVRIQDASGASCERECSLHVAPSVLAGIFAVWHFDSGGPSFPDDFRFYSFDSIGSPSVVAGKLSNAVRIEPTEGLVDNSFQTYLGLGASHTIHFWIKFTTLPNGAQTYVDVVRKSNAGQGYILRVLDDGTVQFFSGWGPGNYDFVTWGGPNLLTNTWYQIICGRDAGNLYVQVNTESVLGSVVSSAAGGSYVPDTVSQLIIPDDPPGTHTSDFLIDELLMWGSRFLSLSERTYLWNSGAGRTYPFL